MGPRIRGVVRAARLARERLRDGVPVEERGGFLLEVRAQVEQIRALCASGGARPEDLPAPSRRAYAELQAIAVLDPGALPAPPEGSAPGRKIGISNVVGALDRVLTALEDAPLGSVSVDTAGVRAQECVTHVEGICRSAETTPSALPPRTRSAFALLSWLTDPAHRDHYVDRRDATVGAFRRALADDGPASEGGGPIRWPGADVLVRFQPGRRIASARPREDAIEVRVHVGFLAADDADLLDLAEVVVRRKRVPEFVLARHREFIDSEAFGAIEHELRLLGGGAPYRPKGRVRDLDRLFDRLNERYFAGAMDRPHLDWHAGESQTRFGFHVGALDLVCVDARLDNEEIPEFVAEFVLYHELLHKKHGAEQRGRRRDVHTPAFRADERRHPRCAEAERWLDALARGERAPGTTPAGRGIPSSRPKPVEAHPPSEGWRFVPDAPDGDFSTPPPSRKISRNAPCPCGSGRKYKRCCGGA